MYFISFLLLYLSITRYFWMDVLCKKTMKHVCTKLCEVIVDMKCNNHVNRGQHTSMWSPGVSPSHIIQGPKCYSGLNSRPRCVLLVLLLPSPMRNQETYVYVCIWFLIAPTWLDILVLNSKILYVSQQFLTLSLNSHFQNGFQRLWQFKIHSALPQS